MLYDVCYCRLAARLAEESEMMRLRRMFLASLLFAGIVLAMPGTAAARGGENLKLPPEAFQAMDQMYAGDPDAAIEIARGLQHSQADQPIGYLLEAEARWWKMYCAACEIRWGMVDTVKRGKKPQDEAYLALADKAIHLAQAQLAQSETAEFHLYAGVGFALKARLLGLRGENHNVAHAGVAARAEFLRAEQLDPDMADAKAGLGLYNYYVDTLSSFVKMLRFFMGIPGGNKKEGIRQLEIAANHGVLMAIEARFYLARNLRTYDQQYERAATIAAPLVARYPRNPNFLLLIGNLNAELGRTAKAAEYFQAAASLSIPDPVCAARAHELANSFLASLH
jgi:hypothetical protein